MTKIELNSNVVNLPITSKIFDKVEELTIISTHPIVNDDLSSVNIVDIITYGYIAIVLILLLKGLTTITELFKYTKKIATCINGLKIIYKYQGFVNCSFFNYVFINPSSFNDQETEILLKHENVHAKQWHSADKLLMLLCRAILWFNPLIYLYNNELEKVHEFEADTTTLKSVDTKTYAQLLIKLADNRTTNKLTHNFGKHPVKERIYMLFANKSKAWKATAYTLFIPLSIALFSIFSIDFVVASPFSKPNFTLILDPGHGGKDNGAVSDNINEKEFTLILSKMIRDIAETRGIKVINTRHDDSYVTLKQRGAIIGDVLLSIHHNMSDDKNKNGIEIISGNSPILTRNTTIQNLTYNLFQNLKSLKGINTENVYRKVTGSYILEKGATASIMLELGYLSNERDVNFLTEPANQKELANAIVNSVVAHRDNMPYYK